MIVAGSGRTGVALPQNLKCVSLARSARASPAMRDANRVTLAFRACATRTAREACKDLNSWVPVHGQPTRRSVHRALKTLAGRAVIKNHTNAALHRPSAGLACKSKLNSATTNAKVACTDLDPYALDRALLAPRPAWESFACLREQTALSCPKRFTHR